jgi:hypothetical protein
MHMHTFTTVEPLQQALADSVDVVVGTPGRVVELLRGRWLTLRHLKHCEPAPRMLVWRLMESADTKCGQGERMPSSRVQLCVARGQAIDANGLTLAHSLNARQAKSQAKTPQLCVPRKTGAETTEQNRRSRTF